MLKKILFILLGRWKIPKGKHKELHLIKNKVSLITNWYLMSPISPEDYPFPSVAYSMVSDYLLKKNNEVSFPNKDEGKEEMKPLLNCTESRCEVYQFNPNFHILNSLPI